jgi:3-oxoacyl-[acyl-carrier protein] reductase
MNLNLVGKNALVCGSSKGIGKAAALELAALGATVTLLSRSSETMGEIIQELNQKHNHAHDFLVADYSDSADLEKKTKMLVLKKPIHILVNNTGGPPGGPIVEAENEAFIRAFHNHLICNHILVQAVIKGMKESNYGRIINIISTSVKQPLDGLGVSNTIRGAVANWAKTMANELGSYGITVNNVLPGATETERLQQILENKAGKTNQSVENVAATMKNAVPLKRFAKAEEIAAAVAFLASPAAAYINGINLPVDGGRTKSL